MMPKTFSWNQTELFFMMEIKTTETPSPTRKRPAKAISNPVAMPKRIEPIPAIRFPEIMDVLVPRVSAITPDGICIRA